MQSSHGAYHLIARDSAEIVLTVICMEPNPRNPKVRVGMLRQLWRSFTLAMLILARSTGLEVLPVVVSGT